MKSSKKVVYIEANAQQPNGMDNLLAQHGFEVMHTPHEQVELSLFWREAPDVVLLDISGGQQSAWRFFHQLRQSVRTCNIPIIVITSKITAIEDVRQLYAANAADYLSKPFSPHELLDCINRTLCH